MADERVQAWGDDRRRADIAEGERRARIDAMLADHAKRLTALETLPAAVSSIDDKLDDLIADQKTKTAVDRALHDQVREANDQTRIANEKQITSRQFYIGVIGVMTAVSGLAVSIVTVVH